MRIRKLAKELGTDDVSLLALLGRLGHARYTDAEQQLPAPIEEQVRRHARELPKLGQNTLPAPRAPEPVPFSTEPVLTEDALFARAMASVQPLGPQPKPVRTKVAPPPPPRSAKPSVSPGAGSGAGSGGAAGAPLPSGAGRAGPQGAPVGGVAAKAVSPPAGPAKGAPVGASVAAKAGVAAKPPAAKGAPATNGPAAKAGAHAKPAAPAKPAAVKVGVGFEALKGQPFAPAPVMPPAAVSAKVAPVTTKPAAAPPPPAPPAPAVPIEWPPKVDKLVADAPPKGAKPAARPAGRPAPAVAPPKGPTLVGPQADRARADALQARLAEVESRAAESEAAAEEAEGRAAEAAARVAELEAAVAELEALAAAQEGRVAEIDAHRRQLQRDLAARTGAPEPSTIRACFERRGLLGDDEIAAALRALLDAHRVAELARIVVADPEQVEELLWERVLLLGEEEAPPPGVVAVRVPAERSEGRQASVNRAAMSRFATACLVRNIKRVVIVGGSPAYHRTLREGLDPRLDVKLIPGNRRGNVPQVPGADLVILWASTILDHSVSAQFPEGVVIPHRGIARMLGAATDWIESRPD